MTENNNHKTDNKILKWVLIIITSFIGIECTIALLNAPIGFLCLSAIPCAGFFVMLIIKIYNKL